MIRMSSRLEALFSQGGAMAIHHSVARNKLQALFKDRRIQSFQGGDNLESVIVCYDFPWLTVIGHHNHHFKNGKSLGRCVRGDCDDDLDPVLYLSDAEPKSRLQVTDSLFVLIVPIRQYLEAKGPDPARSFLAATSTRPVSKLLDVDAQRIKPDDLATFIGKAWYRPDIRKCLLSTITQLHAQTTIVSDKATLETENEEARLCLQLLGSIGSSSSGQRSLLRFIEGGDQVRNLESVLETVRRADRQQVLQTFKRHLDDRGTARKLTETKWEDFFRRNPWLLGLTLKECQFLSEVQGQPDLGGKDLAGKGGQRGDSLMATEGETRFTVLVALKTPEAGLVEEQRYRNKAYRPAPEVIGGVAQVQAECYRWEASPDNIAKSQRLRYTRRTYTVDCTPWRRHTSRRRIV